MANNTGSNNRLEKPQAAPAMDKFKMEVAEELGLHDYAHMDKGSLPSRVNGYVGGNMVKKLIAYAENQLADAGQDGGNVLEQVENAAPTEQIGQDNG